MRAVRNHSRDLKDAAGADLVVSGINHGANLADDVVSPRLRSFIARLETVW